MANPFNLTYRAREDLRGIWKYTTEVWNETQADRYITGLYKRFSWLAEFPRIGKHRPDICEGYYCFPQGSHLVFYLIRDNEIDIIGVPHKEMDIHYYFDDNFYYSERPLLNKRHRKPLYKPEGRDDTERVTENKA